MTQGKDRPTTTVELRWEGAQKYTSSDAYGHTVTVDAPIEDGESFAGFKPGEMLLTSLAGCSGIDVANILRKQRQELTGIEIRVTGLQAPDPPWTWEEIHLEYVVTGTGLNAARVERAIHLSETKYCSVAASLGDRTKVSSTFRIVEDREK